MPTDTPDAEPDDALDPHLSEHPRRERVGERRRRARTGRTVVAATLTLVLLSVVFVIAWIGVRGALAYAHVSEARALAGDLSRSLGEPTTLSDTVTRLAEETRAARELTSDPIWNAAETAPWIGPQLAASSTVIASIDDVAREGVEPLAAAASGFSLDTLRPRDGAFDVAAIAAVTDAAATASATIARAESSVAAIDAGLLLPPLRTPIAEVTDVLGSASAAADTLHRATQLLPAALGANGPREYLVVFQNNAEWRSLGGIVGAMAAVHTDAGRIELAAQASSSDFRRYADPVLPLDDELAGLFVDKPGVYIQNVTQIPDFTVDGPLAREMWLRETGTSVNGVIAVDPVTLSYLLEATGPLTLPSGDTLTSENAVSLLLNEVYARYRVPAQQDAFFAATAATVFTAISRGEADPVRLIDALARAGAERRLFVWNADPAEQAVLDGTTLQGTLPVTDATTTAFGAYLNDGTGSKMDYYVDAHTAVGWCAAPATEPGDDLATLSVTLTNTAPADAATILPPYITGGGSFGVDPGVARTVAYLYLPTGSELVTATGTSSTFGQGTHDGRTVLLWESSVAPGQSATVSVQVRTPRTENLMAITTPTTQRGGFVDAGTCPLTDP